MTHKKITVKSRIKYGSVDKANHKIPLNTKQTFKKDNSKWIFWSLLALGLLALLLEFILSTKLK